MSTSCGNSALAAALVDNKVAAIDDVVERAAVRDPGQGPLTLHYR